MRVIIFSAMIVKHGFLSVNLHFGMFAKEELIISLFIDK